MEETKKKVGFASGIGFVLAAAGSAVGLGNIWGFPYKTSANGGAAFVIVYILCVIFIGFITMMAEIFIGKRAQANPISSYKKVGKGIGFGGLISIVIPFLVVCYYSVLGGWTTKFALNSFSGNAGLIQTFSVNTGEVILYTAIFMLLCLLVVMGGVQDSIEKMSKVLMPILFVILVVVVIYALCLGNGVAEGLAFYLKPDFSLLTPKAILTAMGQAFFSLSIGMGAMITYGSYTGKEINIVNSTAMICFFDTLVAFLAGLAIFPSISHFDPSLLGSAGGIGLIYKILPQVFDSMGVIGQVVSFLFFSMVIIAALTSDLSLIEVVNQFAIQKTHGNRKKCALIVGIICFAISIPIGISVGHFYICGEKEALNLFGVDWLTFFDEVTNTVLMPVCALLACIAVGWIIKPKNAIAEMEADGVKFPKWLKGFFSVMVRYITPLLIIAVEIFGIIGEISGGNASIVIVSYAIIVICIAVYFLFFKNMETGTNADETVE